VCGSGGYAFESTSYIPRNMVSGKPSNRSARGVDIAPTTRILVLHTHRRVGVRSAQRTGVRSCSRATDVRPGYWCAYGPTVTFGGTNPRFGMKGKRLLRNNHWISQACELGLPLQCFEIRFRIVRFS
jgi:hypothetical protein